MPARVDAREANFSDSIASRRKAYRTINRAKKKRDDGTEVLGDFSDEEDESLERKLARLRREAEELKEDIANQNSQTDTSKTKDDREGGELDDSVLELTRALDNLHSASRGGQSLSSAEEALLQKLSTTIPTTQAREQDNKGQADQPTAATSSGLLANAASFDSRLTLLEAALGIPNTSVHVSPDDQSGSGIQPVLPAINHLESQLATLSSTLTGQTATLPGTSTAPSSAITTPHIESLTTRIRKLTADADALSAARRRATEAARAAIAARIAAATSDDPPDTLSSSSATETDSAASEQAAKVQALYTTLPTINSLHPLLPSVLDRLRSLRAIHAGAAHASEDLDALEKQHAETKKEIDQWREGLNAMEAKVGESEATMKNNMDVMGPWVKDLESRLRALGG